MKRGALLLAGALLLHGCVDLTVPEYNNPRIEDIETNPTPTAVRNLATGLLIGARTDMTDRVSYVPMLGILGRESYTLDGADPRFISELLVTLSNSGAFGAGLWAFRYQNIRNANILLSAVERIPTDPVAGLVQTDKEAIRGFAKTMQALDFLLVINTRDVNGAPIDVGGSITDPPAPLASKAAVFAHIVQLLDEAKAHLQAGGTRFSFPLSAGFEGLDTPATFLQFNRALKARVDVYMNNHGAALTALSESFIDRSAPLTRGAYHAYGIAAGDAQNVLSTLTTIYVHPRIVTNAEQQPNGALDRRVQAKVREVEQRALSGLSSQWQFTMYTTPTAPVPILRNEELILIRAEARWFTNDRQGAMEDLNFIRVTSGGLAPIATPSTDAAFVTELLKQRTYSLLFEGGHRWIDHRRFNRLDQLEVDVAGHRVHPAFLVPEAECLARQLGSTCSAAS